MIQWQFALKSSIVSDVVFKGNLDFKSIEPYPTAEFAQGLTRILELPTLPLIIKALYPDRQLEEFIQVLRKIKSIQDFQGSIISDVVHSILHLTSKGLTLTGLTQHDPNKKYLYISNHRDIICDPAFLTNSLYTHGYGTPKICLGDNLLTHPLIIDLVKMNKGVTVKRNLPPRELLKFSFALSTYIYDQINQNIDSVWIAQREGRAKDGNDRTQSGILKMLTMAGEGEFFQRINGLNIIPVSISYEYDPCDALKARELYLTEVNGSYQKGPSEDVLSIRTGIMGHKGRIHINFGAPLSEALDEHFESSDSSLHASLNKREQVTLVANILDEQIRKNFQNWPSNYIAYDLLAGSDVMKEHYSNEEKSLFLDRMEIQLNSVELGPEARPRLRQIFLESYANSVQNSAPLSQ
jgi:hypothetical protein